MGMALRLSWPLKARNIVRLNKPMSSISSSKSHGECDLVRRLPMNSRFQAAHPFSKR